MRLRNSVFTIAAVLVAALLAVLAAWWTSIVVEKRTAASVTTRLLSEGITWTSVEADGLQVRLSGTAPNEAARFRVVNMVGSVVQANRIRDEMEVTAMRAIEAPKFSVEILRNDDGISLIGLVPGNEAESDVTERVTEIAQGGDVSDMLETADYPTPEGWDAALEFGIEALRILPRSKISISAEHVAITAISSSAAEKRKLESDLARRLPSGLTLQTNISAPRPVLTPFTLRFVKDEQGARFDACSADSGAARTRILAAGTKAGISSKTDCTIGLGVPSTRWAEAAEVGIAAVAALGAGTITFSDADVTLMATPEVSQATFDHVVGELQANLPPLFSLEATLPRKATTTAEGPAEFTATKDETGHVQLRGRLTDEVQRDAVESYAKSQFGASYVYTATRLDEDLSDGWAVRVLAGIEALSVLHHGKLMVRDAMVEVSGMTGRPDGRALISQILSDKLGQGQTFRIDVTYAEKYDPLAALPTPQECVTELNAILARKKITFAPGSAEIDGQAHDVMDALTEVLSNCPPLEMEISGFTDAQGSTGGNRALSQARAEAVLTALEGRQLIVAGYTAKGYGEENPIADNSSEEGREANRRIEFRLLSEPEPQQPTSPAALAEIALAQEAAAQQAAKEGDTAAETTAEAPAGTPEETAENESSGGEEEETLIFAPSAEKWRGPRPRPE